VSLPETECGWQEVDIHPEMQCSGVHGVLMQPLPTPPTSAPYVSGPPGQFMAPRQQETSFFRVAFEGGLEVRSGAFNAPLTGWVLKPDEVFAVTEQILGMDGRVYLCLADGRGWVFDDTKLMPHDPSVVRHSCVGQTTSSTIASPYRVAPSSATHLIPPPPTHSPELLASVPAGSAPTYAMPASSGSMPGNPQACWFRVSYAGGFELRSAPFMDAPLTGVILHQYETFTVSEEVPSRDGRVYLRLADGRGWAFDDSALIPHDPCVKRGGWLSPEQATHQVVLLPTTMFPGMQAFQVTNQPRRKYPQPRGKRGGKRASKRKNAVAVGSVAGA